MNANGTASTHTHEPSSAPSPTPAPEIHQSFGVVEFQALTAKFLPRISAILGDVDIKNTVWRKPGAAEGDTPEKKKEKKKEEDEGTGKAREAALETGLKVSDLDAEKYAEVKSQGGGD